MPNMEKDTVVEEKPKMVSEEKTTGIKSEAKKNSFRQGASRFAQDSVEAIKHTAASGKERVQTGAEKGKRIAENIKHASEKIEPGKAKGATRGTSTPKRGCTSGEKVVLAARVLGRDALNRFKTKGENTKVHRTYQKTVKSVEDLMEKVKVLERENKLAYEKVKLADSKERDVQILTDTVASSKKTFDMKTADGHEAEVYAGTEGIDAQRERKEEEERKEKKEKSGYKKDGLKGIVKDLVIQNAIKQPFSNFLHMMNPLKYNTVIDGHVPTR